MQNRIFLTFACPLKWDDLADIDGEVSRRQCEKCQCSVQKVDESSFDQVEAMRAAEPNKRHCVAVQKAAPQSSLAEVIKKHLLERLGPLSVFSKNSIAVAFSAFLLAGSILQPLETYAGDMSKDHSCYFQESSKLGGMGEASANAKLDFAAYNLVEDLLQDRLFTQQSSLCHNIQITDFLRDFERGVISKGKVLSLSNFFKDNGNFADASKFFALYQMFDTSDTSKPIENHIENSSAPKTRLIFSRISPSPPDVFQACKAIEDALAAQSLIDLEALVPGLYNGHNYAPKMKSLADQLHTFLLKVSDIAIQKNDQPTLSKCAQLYNLVEVRYPHLQLTTSELHFSKAKQTLEALSLERDASELVSHSYPLGKFFASKEPRAIALSAKYRALLKRSKTCRKNKNAADSLFYIQAAGVLRRNHTTVPNSDFPTEELLKEIVEVEKKANPSQKEMLALWKKRFCSSERTPYIDPFNRAEETH